MYIKLEKKLDNIKEHLNFQKKSLMSLNKKELLIISKQELILLLSVLELNFEDLDQLILELMTCNFAMQYFDYFVNTCT
jgi:hypothetical protein